MAINMMSLTGHFSRIVMSYDWNEESELLCGLNYKACVTIIIMRYFFFLSR